MPTGNGAFVVHKLLEKGISGYRVAPYNPWLTLFPPLIRFLGRRQSASLIHTTPDYAIWSKRRGVPLVITLHNYVLDPFMSGYSNSIQRLHYRTDLRWFTRRAIDQATLITAVSHFTADLALNDLKVNREIQVIYNGVDEKTFTPAPNDRPRKKLSVLFSGNLTERKGKQWIIPIANRLNKGIEIIYTQGLRTKSRLPPHPRLRCVGNIPHENMPELYRQADILLLTSVREGLPMAVLEAMSCGIPIVATRCSSLPELVENGHNGFLCSLGDVDDFSEKINTLADSPLLRKKAGQLNRSRVEEHFKLEQMVSNYRNMFEIALEN